MQHAFKFDDHGMTAPVLPKVGYDFPEPAKDFCEIALVGEAVRLLAGLASMVALGSEKLYWVAAAPFRDLFGFAVWCGGMVGDTVEWRGLRFRLRRDGRLIPE